MATWQSKLNKSDMKHLRSMGMDTLSIIETTLAHQADSRRDKHQHSEPCYSCRYIAVKLGLPT